MWCRVQYGGSLEASDYQHNAADGIYMLLLGMLNTLVSAQDTGEPRGWLCEL